MAQQDQTPEPDTTDEEYAAATAPIYSDVEVELGQDTGNGFLVISRVRSALRLARATKETIDDFTHEAMSHDYATTLSVVEKWVTLK